MTKNQKIGIGILAIILALLLYFFVFKKKGSGSSSGSGNSNLPNPNDLTQTTQTNENLQSLTDAFPATNANSSTVPISVGLPIDNSGGGNTVSQTLSWIGNGNINPNGTVNNQGAYI